ncbi:MAG: diaminopimelate epimerase [Myxococcales bacterium]|nr:diaminopimelate epimerase [Myxococcales bacterium]
MQQTFAKYEGIGNDFILIEAGEGFSPADAKRLCDRHRGIGADGVLLTGVRDGRPFMVVMNADGSTAEMCGNGIRCVALHVVRRGWVEGREFDIDTGAGPHHCRVDGESVQVTMRSPSLDPGDVPVDAPAPVIEERWVFNGTPVKVTALSMGNPHMVTFDALEDRRVVLGPPMEKDSRFARGANVGFAKMTGEAALDVHVWERGSGWTMACGTGACAAAVAAVETGRAQRDTPLAVTLPGGTLSITVSSRGEPVRMTGPARHVFDGTVTI